MAKRKQVTVQEALDVPDQKLDKMEDSDSESGSVSVHSSAAQAPCSCCVPAQDTDMLDVDFEFFDPQPIDFHGLKTLLRQLFDVDNQLFDLSALADLILSQPLLGSTVKVADEGKASEEDPYAFLTVLNLHEHREKPVIQDLLRYVRAKCNATPSLSSLASLLSTDSPSRVGLILTERLVNIPPEITPPMYNMLLEEISWALSEHEPYEFTHYLILSKTYTEVSSKLDAEENRASKKQRQKSKKGGGGEIFYFHPEDEKLHEYAVVYGSFEYTRVGDESASDAKRAFQDAGIKPQGHVILIEAGKFEAAVKGIAEFVKGAAG